MRGAQFMFKRNTLVFTFILLVPIRAFAQVPGYMTIEGPDGEIITSGASSVESIGIHSESALDHDAIQVLGFEHTVLVLPDSQSGLPTGQVIHPGITITKLFDQTSPFFYQALAEGELLKKITIKLYKLGLYGEHELYLNIFIEDAMITDIRAHMPNALVPGNELTAHMEDVTFVYRHISWTDEFGEASGSDTSNE